MDGLNLKEPPTSPAKELIDTLPSSFSSWTIHASSSESDYIALGRKSYSSAFLIINASLFISSSSKIISDVLFLFIFLALSLFFGLLDVIVFI